LVKHCQ
jgi:flagellar biosynthesis/type III secretory pathway protein FliH